MQSTAWQGGIKIKIQIKGIGYQLNAREGTAIVTTPEGEKQFNNAVEGWNYFTARALQPFEKQMRDELEANGFDRWLGVKKEIV